LFLINVLCLRSYILLHLHKGTEMVQVTPLRRTLASFPY